MKLIRYFFISFLLIFSFALISQDIEVDIDTTFLYYSPTDENIDDYIDLIYDYAPSREAYVALTRVIEKEINNGNYAKAIETIDSYIDFFDTRKNDLNQIKKILQDSTYGLYDLNIGDGINSPQQERTPIQTADEKTIYFIGLEREGFDNLTEDIFYSEFKGGSWAKAKKLEAPFNSIYTQEAPQGITTDGNTLILFRGDVGNGDLYYANKTSYGWSEAIPFPDPINHPDYVDIDAKITNDGKYIIWVSDRPGSIGEQRKFGSLYAGSTYGNTDIYISERINDSTWGEAINLGPKINTPYGERNPYLHPDGKTLYFSSEGHPGIGRLDLFMAKKENEYSDWTDWSTPKNLGKEINTTSNDRGAIVNTMGKMAFFASEERELSFGGSDIYSIGLPEHLRPDPITTISGKVTDTEGFPLEADIIWENLETGEQLGKIKTDPVNGEFFLILPSGKKYGFFSEKEGYFPISKNIDLRRQIRSQKRTDNIIMNRLDDLLGDDLEMAGNSDLLYDQFKLKQKRKLKMNNLFFETNKSDLLPESFPELDRVVYLLNNYPVELVEVGGHTDSTGSEKYNLTLSERRAKSVRDYLIKKGVKKEILTSKGYGQSEPVETNETEEGRAMNRRVELSILKAGRSVEIENNK